MNRSVFLLIVASVLMSSIAQIVLKAGMSSRSVLAPLGDASKWAAALSIATNPLVLLGLAIYFASALVWLLVLARVQVSLAYPFVGLGFIVTMLLGWLVHGDTLSATRVGGTILIAIGVIVLARS